MRAELAGHRQRLDSLVEAALESLDGAGDPAAVEAELASMRAELSRSLVDTDAVLAGERRDRAAADGRPRRPGPRRPARPGPGRPAPPPASAPYSPPAPLRWWRPPRHGAHPSPAAPRQRRRGPARRLPGHWWRPAGRPPRRRRPPRGAARPGRPAPPRPPGPAAPRQRRIGVHQRPGQLRPHARQLRLHRGRVTRPVQRLQRSLDQAVQSLPVPG